MKVKKAWKWEGDKKIGRIKNGLPAKRSIKNIKQQVEQEMEDDLTEKLDSLDDTDGFDAIGGRTWK